MKKYNIVKLINEKPYSAYGLEKDMRGIVIEEVSNTSKVLFFNPQNVGDYTISTLNNRDLICEEEQLPKEIKNELIKNLDKILYKAKPRIKSMPLKAYDLVELLVDKYEKYGIKKGEIGCVMDTHAVQNYILVDFSGINTKGDYYGDCISVKIEDVKVIKK